MCPADPPAHGRVTAVTLYGTPVQKTTVYLDHPDYQRLKAIARAQGRAPAELTREAVAHSRGT